MSQVIRIVTVGLALALGLAGCKGGEPETKPKARQARPAAAVTVVPVSERTIAETLSLTGTLVAERQVAVAPRVSGRLAEVAVQLGDRVAPGQLLARLDDIELKARLEQARAGVTTSKATLSQRQIEFANFDRQAERDKSLLEQDFIALQDYENSRTRADTARVAVEMARSELARQQAALREAQEALAQAVLRAPMAGVVSERHLDPGAIAQPGSPVVTLVAPGAVKSTVSVAESALPRLKPGTPATVAVDAWPDATFTAKVTRVSPVVSPDTRMGQVELKVSDPEGRLRPGMFARLALTLEQREGVPAVPKSALVTQNGRQGVFVTQEGAARFTPVRVGLMDESHAELLEGPTTGTPVIVEGATTLKDGAAVQAGEGGPRGSR